MVFSPFFIHRQNTDLRKVPKSRHKMKKVGSYPAASETKEYNGNKIKPELVLIDGIL